MTEDRLQLADASRPAPPAAAAGGRPLRVVEAIPKDVDRATIRVDPATMRELGVAEGSYVEITGARTTIARALPWAAEGDDRHVVHMDGVTRTNAGTTLDASVQVRAVVPAHAAAAALELLEPGVTALSDMQTRFLLRLLDGFPLVAGDKIRLNVLGTRPQTFRVARTAPPGPVVAFSGTQVTVLRQRAEGEEVALTYEDIGGLHREIRRIREMVELPMKYPQVFEHLGIGAPRGVLLHGPPGTGKTLIARAVAHEASAYFMHINGPEIIEKWYGSSEARLREVFKEASDHAPAILFIDEIDAIAPKREEMSGDRQVERRVVAQLLAMMDGLESRGQVVVVAATNIPNTLDPALRRPGRFDREIAIGVPDRDGRLEILHIHSRGMPLSPDVDLDRLARVTHGYVGADLEALCREAAMSALRRLLPDIDMSEPEIPYEKVAQLAVTNDDFLSALTEVEPSAIREVMIDKPDVAWEDVGGLEEAKRLLVEAVEWPLKHPEVFADAGIRPPRGIMLYGAPGTGKTLLAKALAHQTEINFIPVKGPALLSMWVGESERGVREVFRKARQVAPCIVFFDEIDALTPPRAQSDTHVVERVVSQFLTEMDGIEELAGVMVLAATNRLDLIDKALLRPGRFDLLVELSAPDQGARLEILRVQTRRMRLAPDVDLDALAARTEGLVGADLASICQRAGLDAIRDHLAPERESPRDLSVNASHFEAALKTLAARGRAC